MPKKKETKLKIQKTSSRPLKGVTAKKGGSSKAKKQTKPKPSAKKAPLKGKIATKSKPQTRTKKIPLVIALDPQAFYAINGSVLRSIDDLYRELETMLDHEYLYHKNTGDHFSIWVREVLLDEVCAKGLSKAVSREKARAFLKKRLKHYKV